MEQQNFPSNFFSEVALVVAALVVHAVFFQILHQQQIIINDDCLTGTRNYNIDFCKSINSQL